MASSPVFAVTPRLGVVGEYQTANARQSQTHVVLTSGTSYSVPAGVTRLEAWAIGGGSARYLYNIASAPSVYAATSGVVTKKTYFVYAGQTITYSIGVGGVEQANSAAGAGSRGGTTTFTLAGATMRAPGGGSFTGSLIDYSSPIPGGIYDAWGASTVDSMYVNPAAPSSPSNPTKTVRPPTAVSGDLSAIYALAGATWSTVNSGAGWIPYTTAVGSTGFAGAVVLRMSDAAVPLIVGAAAGTRIEEIRFWAQDRAFGRRTSPSTVPYAYSGSLELWLQNTNTGFTAPLHNWYFDGTSDMPVPPPVLNLAMNSTAQMSNFTLTAPTTRWGDLCVKFDSLILPDANWRILVHDRLTTIPEVTKTTNDSAQPPPWSVMAQGADL